MRIDGPEAASADNAVEVENYHVQIKLHEHCNVLYRMKIKSEARSAVNLTFYSLVFLSLLVWEMSGGFRIFATKTAEVNEW